MLHLGSTGIPMKICVDDIPQGGLHLSFDGQTDVLSNAIKNMPSAAGVRIDPHVRGAVQVLESRDGTVLGGSIRAVVRLECSRCLEIFDVDRYLDLNFMLRVVCSDEYRGEEIGDTGADELVVVGSEIDLGEIILQELLLDLPMKPLCREECPGLCPRCGAVKGSENCTCGSEDHQDPRWGKLAKLAR